VQVQIVQSGIRLAGRHPGMTGAPIRLSCALTEKRRYSPEAHMPLSRRRALPGIVEQAARLHRPGQTAASSQTGASGGRRHGRRQRV